MLFPASMFYTEEKLASTYYNRVQETLVPVLASGEDQIELAPAFLSEEDGKLRIFVLNGISYYMCVCHDIFGLRHKNLSNPRVDVVLNLVHCFYQRGKGPSGLALFAKHCLAGASKQWKCPVFAAVFFFKPNIPTQWPTGVYWNQGDMSTAK